MNLRRVWIPRLSIFTLLVAIATPALAHHVDKASVTADCTGYTITVTGSESNFPNTVVDYTLTLTPSGGGPPIHVTGSVPVNPDPDGTFHDTLTRTWADEGVNPGGTNCFTGTATMRIGSVIYNTVDISFTPECLTCEGACTGSIGDFVWHDLNGDGFQGASEPGIPGVTLLLINSSDQVIHTTTTDPDGGYLFSGLCPGSYSVEVETPPGFTPTSPCSFDETVGDDSNCSAAPVTLPPTSNRTIDFGFVTPPETCKGTCIALTKGATPASVDPNKPVTYTYTVTNTGTSTLTGVKIVDDHGTPGFPDDDVTIVDGLTLASGESRTFTAAIVPAAIECVNDHGSNQQVGTLSATILPGGDVKVIYLQSLDVVDNTYGSNSSAGWGTHGHKFNDLTGSDKAEFAFTNGAGAKVLDFTIDYISASSSFPSGYGTLGFTGGDGKFGSGSPANVLSYDTTLSATLNKPQFRTGFTQNSPAPPNSEWSFVDGYAVVVSKNAFGTSGFGGVSIPLVHNSPPKVGQGGLTPIPCDADSTNTATATGTAGSVSVSASDFATVHVKGTGVPACTHPDPKTGKCKEPKPPKPPKPPRT